MLPFDQIFIGDSYAAFNWCPGFTRSPCSIATTSGGLVIPLIPIQACPSGGCLAFNGSVWPVGPGSGSNVPNNREGWTARGLWADNFNNETGLALSDQNFHFFGHSGATAGYAGDTTGLWNDVTDTRTWLQTETLGSNAGSGKTALDILRAPPTGRANVILSCTGNDWLKSHEQATGQKIMADQTTLNSNLSIWVREVLDIIYTNNPLAFVDWFGYVNLPLGEKDGTQYDGNAFKIAYPEDIHHQGLTNNSFYPNPPGTRFCPQLTAPNLTPDTITSIPSIPTSINSTNFARSIHTSTFATDFNQRANVDFSAWYGHWYGDKNYTPPISDWSDTKGFGAGIAGASALNAWGNAFATQDISCDQVNAQWQASLNPLMDACVADYTAAGFNLNAYKTWTIMSDVGTQIGTDKPATQAMNKFGFCDGSLHPAQNTAPILVQRQIGLWRQTSPLAATLHGMKLSTFTVGVVSVQLYEGVPGNIGQDRIYVDIVNSSTSSQIIYIGDSSVTVASGVNPGVPVAAGATYKLVVYGADDIWAVSSATGAVVSVLRTGRA